MPHFEGLPPPSSHTFLAKSEGVNPPLMFIHYQKCMIHPPCSWTSWGRGYTNHSHITLSRKTLLPTSLAHTTFHTIFVTYNSFTHTQHQTTSHNITQHHTTSHDITQHHTTSRNITQQHTTAHNTFTHTHTTNTFPQTTLSDTDFSHDLSSTISFLFPASPIPSSHLLCVCEK